MFFGWGFRRATYGNMHHLEGPTIHPPVGFPVVAAINMTRRMASMCFLNGMFGPRISNTMAMFFFLGKTWFLS